MDQYTNNLERSSKYRYSYLQSFWAQSEKNKVIENHNVRTRETWLLPVISSLGAVFALRNQQQILYSKLCVATLILVGLSFFRDFRNHEILQKQINKINREHPNAVKLHEEYARDLEILRRISQN